MKRRRKTTPQTAAKLSQHISELRWRLFGVLLFFAAGGAVTYLYRDEVFQLLLVPLEMPLYYTTPAGSFSLVMRFCAIGAAMAAIPMLVYQIIMFIRPAFSASISRLRVYVTSVASLFLALAGMAFGFSIILPASLHFFAGFQMEGLESIISADSYLTLVTNILITFALAFQLPLIISFVDHIKPLKPQQLFKMEKWVVLGSLVVSAFVPFAWDLATSLLIAAPIVVLYNLAIVAVLLQHAGARNKKHLPATEHKETVKADREVVNEIFEVADKPIAHAVPAVTPLSAAASPTRPASSPARQHKRTTPKAMDIMSPTRSAPRLVPPQRVVKLQTIQPTTGSERLITDILRQPRTT